MLHSLSSIWNAIAPPAADHLWQSTVFAAAAAVIAVALRRNSARLRYAIWLVASLKFLVPFSLLVAAGSLFSWRRLPNSEVSSTYGFEIVGHPFSRAMPPNPTATTVADPATVTHIWPLLLGLWLVGFLVVLALWTVRWRRVSVVIRNAAILSEGREVTTLQRLGYIAGRSLKILLSAASIEPGVFGIFRPVLLWPRTVTEHLDDAQLEAVIAHELCHVRRRDNLVAALHMVVEAVFWFHPLVWWIGSRLIEERERACDESVLELGSTRQVYAESILKICKFCLTSPLTCVSAVTGSDLKKRMVHIMTGSIGSKLDRARMLLLWTAATLAIALPVGFGVLSATPSRAESPAGSTPSYSTVTVKSHPPAADGRIVMKMMMVPVKDGSTSGFTAENVTLHSLIQNAYRIQETQLTGAPDWAKTDHFDISATMDPAIVAQMRGLDEKQRELVHQQMLQNLLADDFKLKLHQESRELPSYELTVADGGTKLTPAKSNGMIRMGLTQMGANDLRSEGTPLSLLSNLLSQRLGRTVTDKTGLTGNYSFSLRWTPDADEQARLRATGLPVALNHSPASPTSSAPPLLTAVEEQLGLKLQPTTERVPILVVDHAEQPPQN